METFVSSAFPKLTDQKHQSKQVYSRLSTVQQPKCCQEVDGSEENEDTEAPVTENLSSDEHERVVGKWKCRYCDKCNLDSYLFLII